MPINTFEMSFEERKDYVDRMISLGILSLMEGNIVGPEGDRVGPSKTFIEVFGNVVKDSKLRLEIVNTHDPDFARAMFCSGALVQFVDMIRDEELFHMINTMTRFINYPPFRVEDSRKLIGWVKYYFEDP